MLPMQPSFLLRNTLSHYRIPNTRQLCLSICDCAEGQKFWQEPNPRPIQLDLDQSRDSAVAMSGRHVKGRTEMTGGQGAGGGDLMRSSI